MTLLAIQYSRSLSRGERLGTLTLGWPAAEPSGTELLQTSPPPGPAASGEIDLAVVSDASMFTRCCRIHSNTTAASNATFQNL
jgi:hypothetical protein